MVRKQTHHKRCGRIHCIIWRRIVGAFFIGEDMFDYLSTKWKKKRKKILRMDQYRCRIAAMYGRTEEAQVVHHIYPAKKYPQYAWCDWNLISVSLASHNKLENRNTGELTKLGKELMRRTKPGVDWRKRNGRIQ